MIQLEISGTGTQLCWMGPKIGSTMLQMKECNHLILCHLILCFLIINDTGRVLIIYNYMYPQCFIYITVVVYVTTRCCIRNHKHVFMLLSYWTNIPVMMASDHISCLYLFDLLKSLYSDTKILSKYTPSLQKKL
jgi:hypothetical protein